MARPNLFIVGAAKAGTTTLSQVLGSHPKIYFPEDPIDKEPSYFSDILRKQTQADYLRLYSGATADKKYFGDASVSYLTDPSSARRIYEYDPASRIVILLRNPADRAYSLYNWMVQEGYEYSRSFEEALRREPRRKVKQIPNLLERVYCHDYLYFEMGLYYDQVKRYVDLFPHTNVHLDLFEELVRNPHECLRRLWAFLDLPPLGRDDIPQGNPASRTMHPWVMFLVRYLARFLWPKRSMRSFKRRDSFVARWRRPGSPPPMREDTRKALMERYRGEFDKLERDFGLNLAAWRR